MDAQTLFSLVNFMVLPGWALLVFVPRWKWSARVVAGVVIPGLIGVVYLYLIVRYFGASDGGFGSIADVRSLFANDHVLVAGWAHYLAFDLFVGAWEVRDAQRIGVHHLAVVPCLLLTFMFGPIGLLCYLGLRVAWRRRVALGNGSVSDEPAGRGAG